MSRTDLAATNPHREAEFRVFRSAVRMLRRLLRRRRNPAALIWASLLALQCGAEAIGGDLGDVRERAKYWLRIESQVEFDSLRPSAIAVDPLGRTYLCEEETNRLFLLDERYRVTRWTGGFGWEKEQFDRPTDLCARNGLDVFVSDYNNHRIQRFDKDLNFLACLVGPELDERWRFTYPVSVDQSAHGDLFVLQRDPPRVVRFDALGQPRLTFGELESGPGKLVDPLRLEIGDDERIYVLDAGERSVKVFDFFGNYISSLGGGMLRRPISLAWVDAGTVVIFDEEQGLLVFSPEEAGTVAVVPTLPGPVVDVAARGTALRLLVRGESCEIWTGRLEPLRSREEQPR